MPVETLSALPGNSVVFIDANIFIYALSGQSGQCRQLLQRCLREEVTGITPFETVNEVTQRLMVVQPVRRWTSRTVFGNDRNLPERPDCRGLNRYQSATPSGGVADQS